MDPILDFLRGTRIFEKIPAQLLSRIATTAKVIKKPAGSILFSEGEGGDAAYLIVDGTVSIQKSGVQIVTRSKGDWVGELAILDESPRSTSVITLSPVKLLKFDACDFLELFGKKPALARAIHRHLSSKIREDVSSFDQNRRIVQELRVQRDALVHALNRLPLGVILVDRAGKIILLNRSADAILKQNDGLTIRPDGLYARTARDTATLHKFIENAVRTGAGQGSAPGAALSLSRKSSKRPLSILVMPLASEIAVKEKQIPAAAIFVSDPEAPIESAQQILRRLYDLTPAEVKVVMLLLQGKTLEEAARELKVTMNTVRSHLKSVFAKTDTARQGDLIRLLLTSPAALLPS